MDLGEEEVILCGQVIFFLLDDVVVDVEIQAVILTNSRWWQCGGVLCGNGMVFEGELMAGV